MVLLARLLLLARFCQVKVRSLQSAKATITNLLALGLIGTCVCGPIRLRLTVFGTTGHSVLSFF